MAEPTEPAPSTDVLVGIASFARADELNVDRDGFNPHFQYAYMTELALFAAARKVLADAGMSGMISFDDGSHELITATVWDDKSNREVERTSVLATVVATLTVRDQKGTAVMCKAFGQGLDGADKAYAKAMTMASKYVVQKALMIGVQANDDTDAGNSGQVQSRRGNSGGRGASEKQLGFMCSLVKKLHLPTTNEAADVEAFALRLARMQGDPASEFAAIGGKTASDLIEKLKSVESNPRAQEVITARLVAWETENGHAAAVEPINPDPQPTNQPGEPVGDDDVPF